MSVRVTVFFYRLLLFAFPAHVRRQFGDDMTQMFAMQIEDTRREGRNTGGLWLRAVVDALSHGIADRVAGGKPPGSRWRWWVRAFQQDVKYAFRVLARQPGVTLVAILTLALGIGANSAIFSAVNAVLLSPLPYDQPDRLMTVWEKRPGEGVMDNVVAPADFVDWVKMNTTFESMAALTTVSADLTGSGEPVRLFAGAVSPPLFDKLIDRMDLARNLRAVEFIVNNHREEKLRQRQTTTR
jgi:putative ABC transport system permease protein